MRHWTADTHWYHEGALKMNNRPFTSVEEMNEAMITRWNAQVKPGDIVYHTGDVAFCKKEELTNVLKRLNGEIHLILGNHDGHIAKHRNSYLNEGLFASIGPYKEIRLDDDRLVCMSHYPMMAWKHQAYGSIMVHGHCHGSMQYPKEMLIFDVGTDVFDFSPISESFLISSAEEIETRIKSNGYNCLDHH